MTAIPGTAMPTAPKEAPATPPTQPPAQEPVIVPVQPYNVALSGNATVQPATPPTILQAPNPVGPQPVAQVLTVGTSNTAPELTSTFHEEEILWYNKLIAWMGFGAVFGVIVAFLGLIHYRLFFLAPLGPTMGTIAWYARDFFQKHIKKFDAFPS